MGSDYGSGWGHGKTAMEAFRQATDDAAWEYGHGGYTGSLAEKDSFLLAGTLPARMTPEAFEALADNHHTWKEQGAWTSREKTDEVGRFGQVVYRTVNHRKDPRPKSLRTADFARMLVAWTTAAEGDKWGPAAGVRLNRKDEREYKADHHLKNTQNKVYYFAGYCSS